MSMNMSSMGLSCGGTRPHSASYTRGALRTLPPVSARTRKSQFWMQLFSIAWYCRPCANSTACEGRQGWLLRIR